MEHKRQHVLFYSVSLLLLLQVTTLAQLLPIVVNTTSHHQVYIIHVERHQMHDLLGDDELESYHLSFLPNTTLESGLPRLLYSYRHVVSGFAARLSPDELEAIRSMPGFHSAERDRIYSLATTYTPEYLGLTSQNGWAGTMMGNGLVIGVIDTGIKPSHPSFSDFRMPAAPPTWKGNCTTPRSGFVCNNKILSAKAFNGGTNPSPVDTNGHGTHVASTAAGSQVNGVSVLGTARGLASGTAPLAHLAIYKVCFSGCASTDIIAGIDQAIKDGVDVINLSLGNRPPTTPLYNDPVALGSFAAIQHKIVPVAAAGNDGPTMDTLGNCAPWAIIVGAISSDRRATCTVELGDGRTFEGQTAYQPAETFNSSKLYPLEYPGRNGKISTTTCLDWAISKMSFKGQIVICEASDGAENVGIGRTVHARGAEGLIIVNPQKRGYTTFSDAHVIAASNVNYLDGLDILSYYLKNTSQATATLHFRGTEFWFRPSPSVSYFSSRGPTQMNGRLIKPDVVAPGVNILAAWPYDVGPNPSQLETYTYNYLSGTSMATPHVSGIAALVKSQHRDWTPAEILSAIVTTANDSIRTARSIITDDTSYDPAEIDTMGAGLVNPVRALDPGLVYGLELVDYTRYLCGLGYDDSQMTKFQQNATCKGVNPLSASELNYPSISMNLTQGISNLTVSRTVTNVGNARENYLANIVEPAGVSVYLSTYNLQFTRVKQQKSFSITFVRKGKMQPGSDPVTRGKLQWDSGMHLVTSPIAIRFI